MRIVKTAMIAGIASAALAGAALAQHDKSKTMLVALPDGSVQHIRYEGLVAPRIMLVPASAPIGFFDAAFGPAFAEMEAQAAAMMRQTAMMQAQAPAVDGKGIVLTNGTGQPVGVMRYSYVSSTTSADGCTQTVRISSDGSGQQPHVIRTSAVDCGTAKATPVPAIAAAPRTARPVTPVSTPPARRPAPKVTPVSAPKPLPEFTPSIII